jgi:hypothetical protein
MADEVSGSDGDYWRTFVAAFTKFMPDRPKSKYFTTDIDHEEFLFNISNGSSEERTSLYPREQIGSFLRNLGNKRDIESTKAVLKSCCIFF